MAEPRRRSEYDDRDRGSADPNDWHEIYRGDSGEGLLPLDERKDENDADH